MSDVIFFIIIFIVILIVPACIRHQRNQARQRAQQDAGLAAFRQQQQAQRRAGQVRASTTAQPQPSAPVEDATETRKNMVQKHLYHRTLEHADSVRNLSMILAAANDRYEDMDDSNHSGTLAKTWRSTEASLKTFVGAKPECSICLDQYQAKETVCWAKNDDCDHIFHQDCIVQWLVDHDDCPLCRSNLLEYEGMNDEEEARESG